MRALLRGESNKEIAQRLGTSAHTVKNQLTALYQKTGVPNRVGLVGWAFRQGAEIFDE